MMTFSLDAKGPFSLAAAARFQETFPAFDASGGSFSVAFPVEGSWSTVGVRVADDLTCHVEANPGRVPEEEIRGHVERILSLDVDATRFAELGERDPVVADLQRQFPGLRPVLFPSAYEAAAWALLGHRISMNQGSALRRRISADMGETVVVGGRELTAFPAPDRLARLEPMPGMFLRKVENLRALGEAAAEGELDVELLRDLGADAAIKHLTGLAGIGPFSAELTLLRGAGLVDFLPRHTPLIDRALAEAYDLGPEPAPAQLAAIGRGWRPWGGWVAFLLRNAAYERR
jgi:DNA-3-methyladenine glycosylase II